MIITQPKFRCALLQHKGYRSAVEMLTLIHFVPVKTRLCPSLFVMSMNVIVNSELQIWSANHENILHKGVKGLNKEIHFQIQKVSSTVTSWCSAKPVVIVQCSGLQDCPRIRVVSNISSYLIPYLLAGLQHRRNLALLFVTFTERTRVGLRLLNMNNVHSATSTMVSNLRDTCWTANCVRLSKGRKADLLMWL